VLGKEPVVTLVGADGVVCAIGDRYGWWMAKFNYNADKNKVSRSMKTFETVFD